MNVGPFNAIGIGKGLHCTRNLHSTPVVHDMVQTAKAYRLHPNVPFKPWPPRTIPTENHGSQNSTGSTSYLLQKMNGLTLFLRRNADEMSIPYCQAF